MSSNAISLLRDVDAYMFDVFGTTVDWFTTVKREVARRSNGAIHRGTCRELDSVTSEWYGAKRGTSVIDSSGPALRRMHAPPGTDDDPYLYAMNG